MDFTGRDRLNDGKNHLTFLECSVKEAREYCRFLENVDCSFNHERILEFWIDNNVFIEEFLPFFKKQQKNFTHYVDSCARMNQEDFTRFYDKVVKKYTHGLVDFMGSGKYKAGRAYGESILRYMDKSSANKGFELGYFGNSASVTLEALLDKISLADIKAAFPQEKFKNKPQAVELVLGLPDAKNFIESRVDRNGYFMVHALPEGAELELAVQIAKHRAYMNLLGRFIYCKVSERKEQVVFRAKVPKDVNHDKYSKLIERFMPDKILSAVGYGNNDIEEEIISIYTMPQKKKRKSF